MRPSLLIRTLYRSPVRTLLTFILLSVVMFAFFSQTAEYAVTAREFNNAAKQYCGVGAAEIAPLSDSHVDYGLYLYADPRMKGQLYYYEGANYTFLRYEPLTQEQISTISSFPYISLADTRYMTAGVSDTFFRLDERVYYNYSLRCVVEGTLEIKSEHPYFFTLKDCKLLAGNPTLPVDHKVIRVYPGASNEDGGGWVTNESEEAAVSRTT